MAADMPSLGQAELDFYARQALVGTRSPEDLEWAATLERLAELTAYAPGVSVAWALREGMNLQPVPLDPVTLQASGGPLADGLAVLAWWTQRPGDAVGVRTGPWSNGVLVGVQVERWTAWHDWLTDNAVEVRERWEDADGDRVTTQRVGRMVGDPQRIIWTAPPRPRLRAATFLGNRAGAEWLAANGQAPDRGGWLLWNVADDQGRRASFKRRDLSGEVYVLESAAAVPWWSQQPDGWRLTDHGAMLRGEVADLPGWMVASFGGAWKS